MADKALKRALGEQLRAIRLARGLTQEQTADQLGIIVRYYAGIERGEHNLSVDTVEALVGKLGLRATLTLDAL
ncbi:helix-turn-helix protein [Propionibacteriaceae bacterium ES.041]|nr:helix-turn-helix protein [Propionibacteriaceae bacterium ES.041]